jgi:hypothetical protein
MCANMLQAKTVTSTSVTSVIAIQAFNDFRIGGILVSDKYGQMLSGTASWKCKNAPVSDDWMTPTFDDSGWSNPVTLYHNGQGRYAAWPPVSGINLNAIWISTTASDFIGTIFCRLRLY